MNRLVFGIAVGYLLGAKAGRERYEAIIRAARRVAGSQTVQSTAGVLRSQVDLATRRGKQRVAEVLHTGSPNGANGYQR